MSPDGRPVELSEFILQAKEAAEERLAAIHRSIFSGKPLEKQPKPAPMPIEQEPR